MSDPMSRSCDNCAYYRTSGRYYCTIGGCDSNTKHEFPEESLRPAYFGSLPDDSGRPVLPEGKKFSLDKLIDDHWKYNEGLVKICFPYGVDGWETDDILRLVEFAYKQSGKHFWKHCKEHYNINGESNE